MQKLLRVMVIASVCLISLGAYASSCTFDSPCVVNTTSSSTSTSTSNSTSNSYSDVFTTSISATTLNGAIGYGDIYLNSQTIPFAVTTLSASNLNSLIAMSSLSGANTELSLISSFLGFGTPKVPVIAFGNDVFFANSSFNVQDPSQFLLYVETEYPGISFTDATLGSGAALASSLMSQSQSTSVNTSVVEVVTSSQAITQTTTCYWTNGDYICDHNTNTNTNYNTDYHTTNYYVTDTNTNYDNTYADWTQYDYYAPAAPAPTVPEPATLLLLGTGFAGVIGVMRRKLPR